jgi:hypothetical protein
MQRHLRVTIGQLTVFDTALVVAATIFDDHVYVVRGDVIAAYITELFALGVEWADYGFLHWCPHSVSTLVLGLGWTTSRRFTTFLLQRRK